MPVWYRDANDHIPVELCLGSIALHSFAPPALALHVVPLYKFRAVLERQSDSQS
jgi:hypothetical protein